ncbi:hypothetical protein OnM2_025115 [Erysiphe neolycopersici]|uniref:DUF202 domain-containing protein n=1 Tax=Erysiphe neolycopersici TaxID=212602 RepID=A0A420I1C1_9PEZI|nr:hypothetical protein OnM2_025115 [Erysiphe neolycopersici]
MLEKSEKLRPDDFHCHWQLAPANNMPLQQDESDDSRSRLHSDENFRLRQHRACSVTLTPEELVDIRAAQRTFEGAYVRTALGQFTFALVILKIFSVEFYSIGVVYAIYGVGILFVGIYRHHESNRNFFEADDGDGQEEKIFRTSGNAVVVLTAVSVITYISLITLTMRL